VLVPEGSRPTAARRARRGGFEDPEVFCADEQDAVPVDVSRWQRLAVDVLGAEGVSGGTELSLLFVGADDMAILNAEHMGSQGPTDVLAFPIDAPHIVDVSGARVRGPSRAPDRSPDDPADAPLLLGDVVICPEVAARQAPTHAGTLDDELALLVVHGILHVLGHDHDEPEQAARMRHRERELLSAHHWHGPVPTAFRQEHQ
jgi:probable rRNA maturation factor